MESIENLVDKDVSNYDYPSEEDDDELTLETDEDDARLEMLLDEQDKVNQSNKNKVDPFRQSNIPTTTPTTVHQGPTWGQPSTPPSWQQNRPWGSYLGSGWNSGSTPGVSTGWGGTYPRQTFGSGYSYNTNPSINYFRPQGAPLPQNLVRQKRVVIINLLDCLYEPWDTTGKPNILPRGIFDLKPRFDSWDRLASLNPTYVVVFSSLQDAIPSFSNVGETQASLEYFKQSLGTYLRLPETHILIVECRNNCGLYSDRERMQMKQSIKVCGFDLSDVLMIGIYSGKWGLSNKDLELASFLGIDFMDLYGLLDGRYEIEKRE